jgi:hypothetical protein
MCCVKYRVNPLHKCIYVTFFIYACIIYVMGIPVISDIYAEYTRYLQRTEAAVSVPLVSRKCVSVPISVLKMR